MTSQQYFENLNRRFQTGISLEHANRKDRELSFEDIMHYQKIILALIETDKIMYEIDEVNFIN